MKEKHKDYKYSIKLALEYAEKRINILDDSNKRSVIDEYREWINDGINKHSVIIVRDDPII